MKTLKRDASVSGVVVGSNGMTVLTPEAITAGCGNLKTATKLLDQWVPQAIVSACYHGQSAGQSTPLDNIAKALPNSVNGMKYANWVSAFTPMWIDVKSKKGGIKKDWKPEDFDIDTLADTNPMEYKPEVEVKAYDIDKLLSELAKIANGEKGKSFEVDDTTRELARELGEIAQVRNLEVKAELQATADLDATKYNGKGEASPAGVGNLHMSH